LLVAVSVLPLLVFGSALIWIDYQRAREAAIAGMQATSRALVQTIDAQLAAHSDVLRTLARSPAARSADAPAFYAQLVDAAKQEPSGLTIGIIDASGRQLLNTAKPFGTPLPQRTDMVSMRNVLETGQPQIGDLVIAAVTRTPVISVNVPIDWAGRKHVLGANLPLDTLVTILRRQALPPGWLIGITDRNGTIIARSVRNDAVVGRKANPLFIERISRAAEGQMEVVSREGDAVVTTWSRSPATGWTIGLSQPKASFAAGLQRSLVILALGGILAVLSGGAAAILLARRIAGPMTELAAGAATLGRGVAVDRPTSGVREIEQVGESMVDAASRLAQRDAERDQFEAHQRVLLSELDHRVKNTLAAAQAIVRNSVADPAEAATVVGRLGALANAHTLLAQSRWRGASIMQIVTAVLAAHRHDDGRDIVSGPELLLTPKATQSMTLLLHELATNAAKYGALSTPEGRLHVQWRIDSAGERHLRLDWRELDGPSVRPPTRRGFGSQLIEIIAQHELGGKIELSYAPSGLICRIGFPLPDHETSGPPVAIDPAAAVPSTPPGDLGRQTILVVEDVALVATEVANIVRTAGGTVVGPVSTLPEALMLAGRESLGAAVLDVNLAGEMVFPVAESLRTRGVPFLFLTGYGESYVWPAPFAAAPRIPKPVQAAELLTALTRILDDKH
jgi:two-component sensor histidine kinase/CheY-like chemotaxis protein